MPKKNNFKDVTDLDKLLVEAKKFLGIKGQFGLGLSIVKKTLNLLNYDITIENNKNGISFVIKRVKK